jgi:MFS superfamily sulfate permease-like transporter
MSKENLNPFKNLKSDIPAGFVVFLVSLPLCLGIAMVSGAPLLSGVIAGIIGGIVVGGLSGSQLGVSGPAAGLAVIILNAITELGGFEMFLVAVIIAGVIQLVLGYAKAGIIAYYFPSSVIHGMLAGIGIMIFMKQIPHIFGIDTDPEGDYRFIQPDGQNTFSAITHIFESINIGIIIVAVISLAILLLWDTEKFKSFSFTKVVPGALVAVVSGIVLNLVFEGSSALAIGSEHTVSLPVAGNISEFFGNFSFPDFSAFTNPAVYSTAVVIAVVASIETLLSVEAIDKLDPYKRVTPTNKELKAQGIGNIIAGLIGGLPITQVIVRSSANQQAGGKTKAATIIHGILLLISIIALPKILNMIPQATLAAVLLLVGYKLAKPSLFKQMYAEGPGQFWPFFITIIGLLFSDLLVGVGLGMVIAISIILYNNFKVPYILSKTKKEGDDNDHITIKLSEDVTFLNKASILKLVNDIPDNTSVTIDASKTHFIHHDVCEIIEDFRVNAETRNIEVEVIDLYKNKQKDPIPHFEVEK